MSTVAPSLCAKRCPLTIAHAAVAENATYAVLLDGSGDSASFGTRLPDDLFANCQSDGGDICFSSDLAGTTQLACEIVAISTSGKTAEIWIPVALNTTTDVIIYVWYKSKSGTLAQPLPNGSFGAQAVWSATGTVLGVWHGGTPSSLSITNSADGVSGTNHGSSPGTGHIGGGLTFVSASSQWIDAGESLDVSAMTIQAWGKLTDTAGVRFLCSNSGSGAGGYGMYVFSNGLTIQVFNAAAESDYRITSAGLAANTFAHVAGTFLGGNATITSSYALYVNSVVKTGSMASTAAATKASSVTDMNIGRQGSGSFYVDGIWDELRISAVRSANYIATDYAIQSSTSLVTVGTPAFVAKMPPPMLFQGAV